MSNLIRSSLLLAACAVFITSCGESKPVEAPKQYSMKGVVLRLDAQVRTAVVKHENIEGWMEAMTMEFPIREAREFEKLSVGKRITATVFVAGDEYWLGNIAEAPPAPPAVEDVQKTVPQPARP